MGGGEAFTGRRAGEDRERLDGRDDRPLPLPRRPGLESAALADVALRPTRSQPHAKLSTITR